MLAMQGFLNPTEKRKQVQTFQSFLTPVERVNIGGVSLAPPVVYPTEMVGFPAQPMDVAPEVAMVEAAGTRVRELGGTLTEAEATAFLQAAGWATELIPAALQVAWCESKWSPYALGDSGRSKGWFQLAELWFSYAGEDPEQWSDPLVNARTALAVYQYDLSRSRAPWTQWSCRA